MNKRITTDHALLTRIDQVLQYIVPHSGPEGINGLNYHIRNISRMWAGVRFCEAHDIDWIGALRAVSSFELMPKVCEKLAAALVGKSHEELVSLGLESLDVNTHRRDMDCLWTTAAKMALGMLHFTDDELGRVAKEYSEECASLISHNSVDP